MSTPLVSVVIPTHNRAYCIAEAIDSALGQTYQNVEVVVVESDLGVPCDPGDVHVVSPGSPEGLRYTLVYSNSPEGLRYSVPVER